MSWTFNLTVEDTWKHDVFDTKEEAIAEAYEYYGEGVDFFVGETSYIDIPKPDAERILEMVDEDYVEEISNPDYDDWLFNIRHINKENLDKFQNDINKAFEAFCKAENIKPTWFEIVKIQKIYSKEGEK